MYNAPRRGNKHKKLRKLFFTYYIISDFSCSISASCAFIWCTLNIQQSKMDKKQEFFEHLVRSHKGTIYTVCYMFSADSDEVADLFQETLINIWKGLPTFAGDDDALRGWVYRVALNTCITLDRKKRRHKTVPLTMDVSPFDTNDNRAQRADQLHRRICQLQPFDRAIILLWLEDISYAEIGQILGISANNVSVRLVRIREQMKKMKI